MFVQYNPTKEKAEMSCKKTDAIVSCNHSFGGEAEVTCSRRKNLNVSAVTVKLWNTRLDFLHVI